MAEQEQVEQPTPEPEPEPENPDAEPDEEPLGEPPEPEPTPEPAPHEPSSQTVIADHDKAINAAAKTHETRLRTILGDAFEAYNPCPLCLGDAFLIPVPPGRMAPEQWEAIELASGHFAAENFKTADYAEMCETCDGYGQVLSGSKTDAGRLIVCRPCEGKGWKAKLELAAPPPTFALPAPPTSSNPSTLDWTRPRDAFGRPEGHPHFGMEPSLVGLG